MKKRILFHRVFCLLAASLTFLLGACADFSESQSGSVSFSFNPRALDSEEGIYTLTLACVGDYETSLTTPAFSSLSEPQTLTISKIPSRSKIKLYANLYKKGSEKPKWAGESDYIVIKSGENVATLTLSKVKEKTGGLIDIETQKLTLAKNEEKSSKKFYLNNGSFIFSLLDENGDDILADVDWTKEENSSLFKKTVEFKLGNKTVESGSGIQYDNNEVSISNVFPLTRGGTYNLTITVSPLSKTYVNTSGETVNFPADFESLSGTFEIDVVDKPYFAVDFTGVDANPASIESALTNDFEQVLYAGSAYIELYGETSASYTDIFSAIKTRITTNGTGLYDLDCSGLTTTNTNKSVGSCAMQSCGKLRTLILPDDLEEVGYYAFDGCSSLISVTIGKGTKRLTGDGAFSGCSKLEEVIFPADNKLEIIGTGAFKNCSSLKEITLPDSEVSITPAAFNNSAVEEIKFAGNAGTWYYAFDSETKELIEQTPDGTYENGGLLESLEMVVSNNYTPTTYTFPEGTTITQKLAWCAKQTSETGVSFQKKIYLWRKTE